MEKIKAAVIGYGNIGRYVIEALQVAPRFRDRGCCAPECRRCTGRIGQKYKVVSHLQDLEGVQVAILCNPTRSVETLCNRSPPARYQYGRQFRHTHSNRRFTPHFGRSGPQTPCSVHYVGRLGPGDGFRNTRIIGSLCTQGVDLYQLRSGHEYGTYSSR